MYIQLIHLKNIKVEKQKDWYKSATAAWLQDKKPMSIVMWAVC
jgi:hypothetical protein